MFVCLCIYPPNLSNRATSLKFVKILIFEFVRLFPPKRLNGFSCDFNSSFLLFVDIWFTNFGSVTESWQQKPHNLAFFSLFTHELMDWANNWDNNFHSYKYFWIKNFTPLDDKIMKPFLSFLPNEERQSILYKMIKCLW